MNFLAHFHLAWPDPALVAGALEGDYFKGPLAGQLESGVEQGVRLHRAIDAYTDSHPRLCDLRRAFPPELRRYAGILTDISFDHYLSRHWSRFEERPLPEFNRDIYYLLRSRQQDLGPGARRMLARLVDYDILNAYHRWDAVPNTAARIGERLRRGNPLTEVDAALRPLRPSMESAFLDFYPDLLAFAARYRAGLNQSVTHHSKPGNGT